MPPLPPVRKEEPWRCACVMVGGVYQDEPVVSLYPVEGQPAYMRTPGLVTVLQYAEGLMTDRQAAKGRFVST